VAPWRALEKERGNLDRALEYLNRGVERENGRITRSHQGLHLSRGDVLALLGRGADAESEFRTEIAAFPSAPDAYCSLVLLLATERRLDDAKKVVYDLMKASSAPHTYVVIAETLKAIGDERGAMYWAYQGLQRYPADAELRALPARLRHVTDLPQKHTATN